MNMWAWPAMLLRHWILCGHSPWHVVHHIELAAGCFIGVGQKCDCGEAMALEDPFSGMPIKEGESRMALISHILLLEEKDLLGLGYSPSLSGPGVLCSYPPGSNGAWCYGLDT